MNLNNFAGVMNNREHEKKKKKKVHMASNCSMATEEVRYYNIRIQHTLS